MLETYSQECFCLLQRLAAALAVSQGNGADHRPAPDETPDAVESPARADPSGRQTNHQWRVP